MIRNRLVSEANLRFVHDIAPSASKKSNNTKLMLLDFFEALTGELELPQVRFAHQTVMYNWTVSPSF